MGSDRINMGIIIWFGIDNFGSKNLFKFVVVNTHLNPIGILLNPSFMLLPATNAYVCIVH